MIKPIIIIGGGLAGYLTAKEIRKHDPQTPLFIVTNDAGSFYSKPQLSTALQYQKTAETLIVSQAETMAQELNATIYTHSKVTKILPDETAVVLDDGSKLHYGKLILACGSIPKRAPLSGDAANHVISVNHLDHYADFRKCLKPNMHVAVLGSGLVGCEFANDLIQAGFRVTIISPDEYPLQRFVPQAVGQVLRDALQHAGVQWYLGHLAVSVNHKNDAYALKLNDGQELEADLILSAVGLAPNIELAQQINLEVDNGIVVNHHMQTSVPDIYALGDCAVMGGHWRPFVAPIRHGAHLIAKKLNEEEADPTLPVMPVVVKTSLLPLVFVDRGHYQGHWHVSGAVPDLKAFFIDTEHKLRGFVLSGAAIRERQQLVKQIDHELSDISLPQ